MRYSEMMKSSIPAGESGDCRVEKFTVSKEESEFDSIRAMFHGGRFVPPGDYTKLTVGGVMMMTDTPDEIRDHIAPVRIARGVCLVTGLGLGCVVQGMLESEDGSGSKRVDKVIAIEKSEGVAELVGAHFKDRYGDRFEVRNEDALVYIPPKGERYDVVWHDIWPNICVDNLETMSRLHRKYGRRCNWQCSWQRERLLRLRRQENKRGRLWR